MRRLAPLFFCLLFGGALALAGSARAESPQRFAFEIKFGPYVPALDKSAYLGGATPFSNLMGDPNDPYGSPPARGLISQGEFDYQFFSRFGVLGVGLSAGYYRRTNPAFKNLGQPGQAEVYCAISADPNNFKQFTGPANDPMKPELQRQYSWEECTSQGEENIFNLVPIALMAVYRFDVLDKRLRIPIIPYAKVGFGYYVWWFGNTGNFVSQVPSGPAGMKERINSTGATAGLVLNPGIAINLSALDPSAARAIDREIGLNRVTAFVELNAAFMEGWGARSAKLNLSDTSFSAGLGFEF